MAAIVLRDDFDRDRWRIIDRVQWIFEAFRITVSEDTVSRAIITSP